MPVDLRPKTIAGMMTVTWAMFGILVLVQRYIVDEVVDSPYEEQFDELDGESEVYGQIVADVIPAVQTYARHMHRPTPSQAAPRNPDGPACVRRWGAELRRDMNLTLTDPAQIREVLHLLGLGGMKEAQRVLGPYLESPVDMEPLLSRAEACLGENDFVAEMACRSEGQGAPLLNLGPDGERAREALRGTLSFGVVLELLTAEAIRNHHFQDSVVGLVAHTERARVKAFIDAVFSGSRREFRHAKWDGILSSLRGVCAMGGRPLLMEEQRACVAALQINIAEAVERDVERGMTTNADIGLALMATVFPTSVVAESQRVIFHLGKLWADTYIGWNMAYVSIEVAEGVLPGLMKLMIPSVACTGDAGPNSALFIPHRVFSLFLYMLYTTHPSYPGRVDWALGSEALSSTWARTHREIMPLTMPGKARLEEMFHNLCSGGNCHHGSAVLGHLSDADFKRVWAFTSWSTMVLSGHGLEVLMGGQMLARYLSMNTADGWKYAQFTFPLLATFSFGAAAQGSWLCIIAFVFGVWKVGFPEVSATCYAAVQLARSKQWLRASIEACNGIGLLLHHGSAGLIICANVNGVAPQTREVAACVMWLVLQHWFVLLRYWSVPAYIAIELALEVFFEIEVIGNYTSFYRLDFMVRLAATGMLLAHWLYLIAAAMDLVAKRLQRRRACGGAEHGDGFERFNRHSVQAMLDFVDDVFPLPSERAANVVEEEATLDEPPTVGV